VIARLRQDDRGATLLIVLMLITSISLVMGVVLTQADTSVRATVALRDEAGAVYGADGAAQFAINKIRSDPANPCVTSATNFTLSNYYQSPNGNQGSGSAYVNCTPDVANTGGGGNPNAPNSSPGVALLTLDSNLGEDGIVANVNSGTVKVRGSVFSNSRINAPGGLANTWTPPASNPNARTFNIARGACLPSSASVTVIPGAGTTTCNYGSTPNLRGVDPGLRTPHGASYNSPAIATQDGTVQACTSAGSCGVRACVTTGPASSRDVYQKVVPGRFTSATALNNLTGCSSGVVSMPPGNYYFDFPSASRTWAVPSVYIIAGTPTVPLTSAPSAVQMATACVGPGDATATTTSGVQFIFGGASRMTVSNSGNPSSHIVICASYSPDGPPIAVYGLKTALTGAFPVSAEPICAPTSSTCSVLRTDNCPNCQLIIQGTTYVPNGFLEISLNNNSGKIFRWGLIAWAINFTGTGSADVSNALVDVPDTAPDPIPPTATISYIDVYQCPNSSTCTSAGTLVLRVKVELSPTSPKTVRVLSWSQR
jgi:hypothetical protein